MDQARVSTLTEVTQRTWKAFGLAVSIGDVAICPRLAVGWQLHRRANRAEAAGTANAARQRACVILEAAAGTRFALAHALRAGKEAGAARRGALRAEWAEVPLWAVSALLSGAQVGLLRVRALLARQRCARALDAV